MWGWFAKVWEGLKRLTPDFSSVADKARAVQEAAVAICGYLPTIASITAMLTARNPAVVGVAAIAQAICAAVTAKYRPVGFLHRCVQVNGVCVEGDFVG